MVTCVRPGASEVAVDEWPHLGGVSSGSISYSE